MLTLKEVLADAASSPGFEGVVSVNVHSRGSEGQTPLHWMAVLGDHMAAQLLLRSGAEVDVQDCHGNTALHEAVASRQQTVVRILLLAGASVGIKNRQGQSPKEMAEMDSYAAIRELFSLPAP